MLNTQAYRGMLKNSSNCSKAKHILSNIFRKNFFKRGPGAPLFISSKNFKNSFPVKEFKTDHISNANDKCNQIVKLNTKSFSEFKMKSKQELKKELSDLEYRVTQDKATERPFTGEYYKFFEKGIYLCLVCGENLFSSETKYDSGSGWPSFWDQIDPKCIKINKDISHGMVREEIVCAKCDSHLGHVFDDGPKPTGRRYCVNSCSLNFVQKE